METAPELLNKTSACLSAVLTQAGKGLYAPEVHALLVQFLELLGTSMSDFAAEPRKHVSAAEAITALLVRLHLALNRETLELPSEREATRACAAIERALTLAVDLVARIDGDVDDRGFPWKVLLCCFLLFQTRFMSRYHARGFVRGSWLAQLRGSRPSQERVDRYFMVPRSMQLSVMALGDVLCSRLGAALAVSRRKNGRAPKVIHTGLLLLSYRAGRVQAIPDPSRARRRLQLLLRAAQAFGRATSSSGETRIDLSNLATTAMDQIYQTDPDKYDAVQGVTWALWSRRQKLPLPNYVRTTLLESGATQMYAEVATATKGVDSSTLDRVLAALIAGPEHLRRADAPGAFGVASRVPAVIVAVLPGAQDVLTWSRSELLMKDLRNNSAAAWQRRLQQLRCSAPGSERSSRVVSLEELASMPQRVAVLFLFSIDVSHYLWIIVGGAPKPVVALNVDNGGVPENHLHRRITPIRRQFWLSRGGGIAGASAPNSHRVADAVRAVVKTQTHGCDTIRWVAPGGVSVVSPDDVVDTSEFVTTVHADVSSIPELSSSSSMTYPPLLNSAAWAPASYGKEPARSPLRYIYSGHRCGEEAKDEDVDVRDIEQVLGISYSAVELIALWLAASPSHHGGACMRLAQQGAIDAEWPRRGIAHFVGHGVVSEAKPWEARLQVLVAPPQSVGGLPAFSGWQVLRRKFARAGHSRHPESANWMVEIDRRSVADVLNHLSRPVVWLGGCSVGCQGPDASGGATGLVQAFLDNGTKYVIAPIREVHDLSAAMLACVFYGCAREESTAGQPPDVMLRRAKRLLRLGWAEQPSAANWVVECFSQPTPADMAELIVAPMDLAFDLALSAQTGHCLNVRNELGRREEWHFDRIGEFLIEPLCTDQSDECVRIQWNALKSEAVKSIHAFRTAWKKFVSEFVANRADPRSGWPNPAFADSLNAFCCFQGDPS